MKDRPLGPKDVEAEVLTNRGPRTVVARWKPDPPVCPYLDPWSRDGWTVGWRPWPARSQTPPPFATES